MEEETKIVNKDQEELVKITSILRSIIGLFPPTPTLLSIVFSPYPPTLFPCIFISLANLCLFDYLICTTIEIAMVAPESHQTLASLSGALSNLSPTVQASKTNICWYYNYLHTFHVTLNHNLLVCIPANVSHRVVHSPILVFKWYMAMKWKLQLELQKNSIICMLSLSVFFSILSLVEQLCLLSF